MAKFIEVTHAYSGNIMLVNIDHITAVAPRHEEAEGDHKTCLMLNSGNEFRVSEEVSAVRRQMANPLEF